VASPNCNSLSKCLSQIRSQVVEAITLYPASALDLATTCCFLLFQEIKLSLIRTQYPEVDLLSNGDLAQLAYE